jgi:hypothetical protein
LSLDRSYSRRISFARRLSVFFFMGFSFASCHFTDRSYATGFDFQPSALNSKLSSVALPSPISTGLFACAFSRHRAMVDSARSLRPGWCRGTRVSRLPAEAVFRRRRACPPDSWRSKAFCGVPDRGGVSDDHWLAVGRGFCVPVEVAGRSSCLGAVPRYVCPNPHPRHQRVRLLSAFICVHLSRVQPRDLWFQCLSLAAVAANRS